MSMDNQRGGQEDRRTHLRVFVGADHRGYRLKNKVIRFLEKSGFSVTDLGTHREGVSCDYPLIARKVAEVVAKSDSYRGILVCMTGIGHTIAANKIPGIRAALCYNKKAALLSRTHNDANVLVLGARFVTQRELFNIVATWLKAKFEGGRHLRRIKQIKKIEKQYGCPHC